MASMGITAVPVLALGGESLSADTTLIAVVSLASMIGGYLLLFALWHFVFRHQGREDNREQGISDARSARDPHPITAARIDRRRGARLRRR